MTNYEKIKAMSVEEMAEWLDCIPTGCKFCPAREICEITIALDCTMTFKQWLESEVEEDG